MVILPRCHTDDLDSLLPHFRVKQRLSNQQRMEKEKERKKEKNLQAPKEYVTHKLYSHTHTHTHTHTRT